MIRILLFALLFPVFCSGQSVENLDIKNGFLQFKLGDSISNYKEMINKPDKTSPQKFEVKHKFISIKRYVTKVILVSKKDVISSIEVYVDGADNEKFIENAINKSYGDASEIKNGVSIWSGKRVSAMLSKIALYVNYENKNYTNTNERLFFYKTSDIKINGELGPDFLL